MPLIPHLIIRQCVIRLKSGKRDVDIGFRSDHLINGSQRLFAKDSVASLTRSDNYRGISLFNSICKLFDRGILFLFG